MRLRVERDEAREVFVRGQADRYAIDMEGTEELTCYKAWCDTRAYTVIVSRDRIDRPGQAPDGRWHISVAGERAVPRWADFVAIAQKLRPGVMFCVPMPPRQFWLNVDPRVLHVWEIKDPALERQWREEGQLAQREQRSGRLPGSPSPT